MLRAISRDDETAQEKIGYMVMGSASLETRHRATGQQLWDAAK